MSGLINRPPPGPRICYFCKGTVPGVVPDRDSPGEKVQGKWRWLPELPGWACDSCAYCWFYVKMGIVSSGSKKVKSAGRPSRVIEHEQGVIT